ncbi:MAG: IS110 family transposase, partial [Actinomycetota bacterium]
VPAKLAARVRVLSVGHGRKSDPHDAVSVAVAARSVPAVRRVRVEDQAVVLPLLTKRRVANMRVAVTQRRAQRCADQ